MLQGSVIKINQKEINMVFGGDYQRKHTIADDLLEVGFAFTAYAITLIVIISWPILFSSLQNHAQITILNAQVGY